MTNQHSITDLIQEATCYILDHPEESKLIAHVCAWDSETRAAFILAYRNLKYRNENE
jgi:hypothetical protein